jgi:hypothetical protein
MFIAVPENVIIRSHILQSAGITNRFTTWQQTTMETVCVHAAVQTAPISTCFLGSLSYLTINFESISFVISFLCEIFCFHRVEYKDTVFWNVASRRSADTNGRFRETYCLKSDSRKLTLLSLLLVTPFRQRNGNSFFTASWFTHQLCRFFLNEVLTLPFT